MCARIKAFEKSCSISFVFCNTLLHTVAVHPPLSYHLCRRRSSGNVLKMQSASTSNVVLVDMDNTLVDFDLEFGKRWVSELPHETLDVITSRKHFELEQNFPEHLKPVAIKIMSQPGFFISFRPQPGAVEAVKEMTAAGLHVLFCTAPLPFQYETCVAEKYAWVRKHFGEEYMPRLIITRDKTVVRGRVLVDDKPAVKGICDEPEWQHIVFEQPYNLQVNDKPRMKGWNDWRNVLSKYYQL